MSNRNNIMQKLEEAVRYANFVRAANKRNTDDGGVKIYAKRIKDGQKQYFHENPELRETFDWMIPAIEEALGIKVTKTLLIRRAMQAYANDFYHTMLTGQVSDNLDEFLSSLKKISDDLKACR